MALVWIGGFGEGEESDFIGRDIVEGAVRLVRLRRREHEPGELRREVERDFRDRGPPAAAHRSEAEVISVDFEVL